MVNQYHTKDYSCFLVNSWSVSCSCSTNLSTKTLDFPVPSPTAILNLTWPLWLMNVWTSLLVCSLSIGMVIKACGVQMRPSVSQEPPSEEEDVSVEARMGNEVSHLWVTQQHPINQCLHLVIGFDSATMQPPCREKLLGHIYIMSAWRKQCFLCFHFLFSFCLLNGQRLIIQITLQTQMPCLKQEALAAKWTGLFP